MNLKRKVLPFSILFFIAFLIIAPQIFSQTGISWNTVPSTDPFYIPTNNLGRSVVATPDGGYIVCGSILFDSNEDPATSKRSYDAWVVKYDLNGVIEWKKSYGGSKEDGAMSIVNAPGGGYVFAGLTYSNDGDVSGNANSNGIHSDVWVVKIKSNGAIEWQKCLGGSSADLANGVVATSDGGYVFAGFTYSNDGDVQGLHTGLATNDIWVVKLDGTGKMEWQKCLGGSGFDEGRAICATKEGGFIITGLSDSNDGDVSGNHGFRDMLTIRINENGTIEWQKSLGGSRADIGNSVVATPDGGFIVCGESSSVDGDASFNHSGNNNIADVWVVKLSPAGDIQWQKSLGGSEYDIGYSIQNVPSGGYILSSAAYSSDGDVSGNHSSLRDAWLVKLDQAGAIEWQRCFGGTSDELPYSVIANSDGTFVYTGYTSSSNGDVSNNAPQAGLQTWTVKLGGCGAVVIISQPIDQTIIAGGTTSFRIAVNGSAPQTYQWYVNGSAISGATTAIYTISSVALTDNGNLYHCVVTNCSGTKTSVSRKALLIVKSSADCEENYFIKTYADGASSAYPLDMQVTAGNNAIVCGEIRKGIETDGFIFMVDHNGKRLWELSLSKEGHQAFGKIIPLKDGRFLASGYDYPDINSLSYFLLKFDDKGNVLWRKDFKFTTQEQMGITGMKEAPDGSIIVVAYLLENNLSFSDRMLYFKFDAAGNMLLSHSFGPDDFTSVHGTNDLVIKDGYSYIVGHHYHHAGNLLKGFLAKIDNADGRLVWTRVYDSNGGQENFLRIFDYGGSRLLILGQSDLNASDTSTMLICDTAGTVLSARYFSYRTYRQSTAATLDPSGNLLYASGYSGDLSMCLVNPQTGVLWAKHYPQINMGPNASKVLMTPDGTIFCTGFGFGNNAADGIKLYIGKWSGSGETGCLSENLSIQFGQALTSPARATLIRKSRTFKTVDIPLPAPGSFINDEQTLCLQASTCSSLKISGPDNICGINDTLVLNVTKDESCLSHVNFKYDTSYFSLIDLPGNKVRFKVKKAGKSTITAQMGHSCYPVSENITISVLDVPQVISLGADQMLCTGNELLLNAGAGFASYLWQDQTTDPEFTVTAPGTYSVQAIDACGNMYKDTIVVTAAPPVSFSAGEDRVKCNNDTLHLSAQPGFTHYTWTPNYKISSVTNQNVVVEPERDTAYYVKAEKTPGCYAYDTVRIIVRHSAPVFLGNDTSFCQGSELTLHAGTNFMAYQWNTGATTASISVNTKGTYSVLAFNADGCQSSDTLIVENVYPNPQIQLDRDPKLCKGSTRTLDPGNFSRYLWQDGSTNQRFAVKDIGTYYVEVIDLHQCTSRDTVHITTLLSPPSQFLPADTALCSYGSLKIEPVKSYVRFLWSTSSTTSSIKIDKPGMYWLQVTDQNNCTGKDTIYISPRQCMDGLYVPNAFTPNSDERNDVFRALLFGRIQYFELTVYNRWGEVVFKTNDPQKGWNGQYKGRAQDSNIFVWTCRYQLEGEQQQYEKGTVMVIK